MTKRLEGNTWVKGIACFKVEGLATIFLLKNFFNITIFYFTGKIRFKKNIPK